MRKSSISLISCLSIAAALFSNVLNQNNSSNYKIASAQSHTSNYSSYTYDGNYYSSLSDTLTEGMNGTLRTTLTSLIRPSNFYVYSSTGANHLATQLQSADEDPTNPNNMVYFYTRDSVAKNAASTWNREHVWPQALSNNNWGTGQAGTDILHIRPTYDTTNSHRGNRKYGNVTGNWLVYNDIQYAKSNDTYFEPLDSVKGDCARIIMYLWTAYTGYSSYSPIDITNVFESYDTLMTWHVQDPPDALEGRRNDYAEQSIQGNRNPFVDHPEYAWKIFGEQCSQEVLDEAMDTYITDFEDLTSFSLTDTSLTMHSGDTYKLTVTTNTGANKSATWSSSNEEVATVSSKGLVTAVGVGTATITATSSVDQSFTSSCALNVLQAKNVTSLTISGSSQTIYYENDYFDPKGLTVTAKYDDESTEDVTSLVSWTSTPLTYKQDSVSCTYRNQTISYSGITVLKIDYIGEVPYSITRKSVTTTSSDYNWYNWSSGSLSGQCFLFGGKGDSMQFNSKKQPNSGLFSSTKIDALKSVSITLTAPVTMNFEIYGSDNPFSTTKLETSGKLIGVAIFNNSSSAKCVVSKNYKYFLIKPDSTSGACYVNAINLVAKVLPEKTSTGCSGYISSYTLLMPIISLGFVLLIKRFKKDN